VRVMPLDNAFAFEVQANGSAPDAHSGGPGASFMPKLGSPGRFVAGAGWR
jgi:hypothetical protein